MSVFIGYPSFMAYQMMKGKKDNNDGFPSIPGTIARYSALGLTNEEMSKNPVWVDKMGNGHDLQMKNFAWGGMSGVGGVSTYYDKYEFTPDKYYMVAVSSGTQHAQFTFKVTGLVDGNTLSLADASSPSNLYGKWTQDGIYTVDIDVINTDKSIYFYNGVSAIRGTFTIEILPLYPGALVFDGVDDYGTCDNFPILTKEKGYTVVALRQWIDNSNNNAYLLSNAINNTTLGAFVFERNKNSRTYSFGSTTVVSVNYNPITYQTLNRYNSIKITAGTILEGNDVLLVGANYKTGANLYANAAIWELVFLDHDATEEELTKIKDYFVKTYPWLFPDQAWTVVGKTNEDEDRATIANITGNGHDLVLSNFGFAEGSGYGLYAENYAGGRWVKSTDRADLTWTSYSVNITSVKVASTQLYYQSYPEQPSFIVPSYKIKVYGLKDGQTLSYKQATSEGQQIYKISEDGIYTLPSFSFKANGDWYGFTLNKVQETCDITIEQIPEYEGYLITDGVDDEVRSAAFTLNEDWTIVGNWEFMTNENKNAGLTKVYSFYLYNRDYGIFVYKYINAGQGFSVEDVKSLKAICSDGRIYLNDWQEIRNNIEQEATISKGVMAIGYFNRDFTKMAFKNLGIYNNQILSKDDCIKAYNYLQTLKAK